VLSVGLTGNVASGKSTVAGHFASWGATVIDADELVRDVERPGSPVLDAIARRFGEGMIDPDGHLDRPRLRAIITADARERAALEAIVHPAVRHRRQELMAEARRAGARIVVHDIPLLFEALDPAQFDVVILVDAPVQLRRERLIAHREFTPEEANRLMATQMPSERKRGQSHIVIENAGTFAELEVAARAAWDVLIEQASRDEKQGPST
jgi:dephospho-CoA kinase